MTGGLSKEKLQRKTLTNFYCCRFGSTCKKKGKEETMAKTETTSVGMFQTFTIEITFLKGKERTLARLVKTEEVRKSGLKVLTLLPGTH